MAGPDHDRQQISSGYQGVVYKVSADSLPVDGPEPESGYLIVKEAMGFRLSRKLRRIMIRREHDIYRHLEGVPGIPRCYGLRTISRPSWIGS